MASKVLIKIIVIFELVFVMTSFGIQNSSDEFSESQVILFYAPLNGELIREQIVIYWRNVNFKIGDTVALFYGHPGANDSKIIFSHTPGSMSGVVKTKVPPTDAIYMLNMTYVTQCVGYYGAWMRNNTIRKVNCLSTHPDWMSINKELFKKMTLGKIFLPGTHNSGSYGREIPRPLHTRYTVTQDRDVFDQLVSGARYLDIRPCIYNVDIKKYWVCHGPIFMQPLNGIIYDIKDFMTNTHEIVILSFKEFSRGFDTNDDHRDFIKYLINHFNDFIYAPLILPVELITLGNIWKSNKRLILSYDHPMQQASTYLWPATFQFWPNAKTTDELYKSIDRFENINKNRPLKLLKSSTKILRAVMAEITLDTKSVLFDGFAHLFGQGTKSLFQLGVQVGPLVTEWYNEEYNCTANIVAVDFIDATGIVEVAIHANQLRASPYFIDDFDY